MTEIPGVEFVQEAAEQQPTDAAMSVQQILNDVSTSPSTEGQAANTAPTAETGAQTGDAGQQPQEHVYKSQAEVDAAFGARIQAERNKFMRENKPLMDKGTLLEQYTQGMTDQEIAEALQAIAASRLAKDTEIDEKTARAIVRNNYRAQSMPTQPAAQPEQPAPEADSQRMRIDAASAFMSAVGDPGFTLETLRTNRAALADFAAGMAIRDVYLKYFTQASKPAAPPVEKRGASVSGGGGLSPRYSASELDRIMKYVENGGVVRTD